MHVYKYLAACTALLVGYVLIRPAMAAVSLQPSLPKPAKYETQEGCYSNILDVVLTFGVDVNPTNGRVCQRLRCNSNGDTQIMTCGAMAVPTGCTTTTDLGKPYPGCCPQLSCPVDECND